MLGMHPSVRVLVLCLAAWWWSSQAHAQINSPGRHTRYRVELEPHVVWQWTGDEAAIDDGVGLGFRASIPLIDNGPIASINNNLAISFGLDWAHFPECRAYGGSCSEDDFWFPVVMQWNFFLTSAISIFPEFGLGFRDAVFDYDANCSPRGCRGSSLEVHPVLWFGGRFRIADTLALVLRLGTPSLQFGLSFVF
jgi:hypothetical protein